MGATESRDAGIAQAERLALAAMRGREAGVRIRVGAGLWVWSGLLGTCFGGEPDRTETPDASPPQAPPAAIAPAEPASRRVPAPYLFFLGSERRPQPDRNASSGGSAARPAAPPATAKANPARPPLLFFSPGKKPALASAATPDPAARSAAPPATAKLDRARPPLLFFNPGIKPAFVSGAAPKPAPSSAAAPPGATAASPQPASRRPTLLFFTPTNAKRLDESHAATERPRRVSPPIPALADQTARSDGPRATLESPPVGPPAPPRRTPRPNLIFQPNSNPNPEPARPGRTAQQERIATAKTPAAVAPAGRPSNSRRSAPARPAPSRTPRPVERPPQQRPTAPALNPTKTKRVDESRRHS